MFKHILITLDGTPRSEAVLPPAAEMARAGDADVTLLRVVDVARKEASERGAIGGAPTDPSAALLNRQAHSYLERIGTELSAGGVRVQTVVRSGAAARQIVDTAAELGVDAIAMSTRSRQGLQKLVFGSVAEAVLHETSVPVLLIRRAAT